MVVIVVFAVSSLVVIVVVPLLILLLILKPIFGSYNFHFGCIIIVLCIGLFSASPYKTHFSGDILKIRKSKNKSKNESGSDRDKEEQTFEQRQAKEIERMVQ